MKQVYSARDEVDVQLAKDCLDQAGIESVLVGGAVVAVYTKGAYRSGDLDFISGAGTYDKIQAVLDLTGVYFDDKGVPKANFLDRLVTTAPSEEQAKTYRGDITYTNQAILPPGLYQVRVAAREDNSGRKGSVHGWIEIPDLTKKTLNMSSILLGERTQQMLTNVSDPNSLNTVYLSPSHRFRRESSMRFLVFTYNATTSPTDQKPDVAVQVQIVRDDQPVITTALRKVNTEGLADVARIPYAAEVPLADLQPGRYILQVTLIDRLSKQSTSRQTHFDIY